MSTALLDIPIAATPSAPTRPKTAFPAVPRHEKQIASRPRQAEAELFGLAAYSASFSVKRLSFDRSVLPIGQATHFVLSRRWKQTVRGRMVCLRYVGYKAALTEESRIQVGGPNQVACGFDLKYRPFHGASSGGVILDARKRTTIELGLELDQAIEQVGWGETSAQSRLQLPTFLAGFRPMALPDVEFNDAVRRAVLDSLRQSYAGPAPSSVLAIGGRISEVVVDSASGWFCIGYGPDKMCNELPPTAVLRPLVEVGAEVEPGTVLGDLVPRSVYQSWAQLVRAVDGNEAILDLLVRETVESLDRPHLGLLLRDVRFCPGQLNKAVQVFEGFELNGDSRPDVQVVIEDQPGCNRLVWSDGPIDVDLDAIRPGWDRKFTG